MEENLASGTRSHMKAILLTMRLAM
uniref:Uncharacterized protein n=1 Tax=Arundo donax TaxID=35708 RepID=A0A0A9GXJ1_ARUDO